MNKPVLGKCINSFLIVTIPLNSTRAKLRLKSLSKAGLYLHTMVPVKSNTKPTTYIDATQAKQTIKYFSQAIFLSKGALIMKKIFCDRCGKEISLVSDELSKVVPDYIPTVTTYLRVDKDICARCMTEFITDFWKR